jgi:hypothetical protein
MRFGYSQSIRARARLHQINLLPASFLPKSVDE